MSIILNKLEELPEIEKISVMNLKPDDVLVFNTTNPVTSIAHERIDKKITEWKIHNNITNKHLILSGLKLEVLSKEKCKKLGEENE